MVAEAVVWQESVRKSIRAVPSAERYVPLLRTGRWFRGLPESMQSGLVRAAVTRTVLAGEAIYRRGDAQDGLYVLVEGRAQVVTNSGDGEGLLVAILEAPAWFGESGIFEGQARSHDVIAETDATLLVVQTPALDALLSADGRYWRAFGELLAARSRVLSDAISSLLTLPLDARVAHGLLQIASAYGDRDVHQRRVLGVRQQQLAQMHASSRQSINALLRDFSARGLIRVNYGQLEILDYGGLQRVAEQR